MNRRTILKRIGTVGVATVGITGTAAASSVQNHNVEHRLDVSAVSGEVKLGTLVDGDIEAQLSGETLAALAGDTDPANVRISVDPRAETIALSECCEFCCNNDHDLECPCFCCVCDSDACDEA